MKNKKNKKTIKEIEKSLTKAGKKYLKEKGKLPPIFGSDDKFQMLDSGCSLKETQPPS
jgi:hypothetical protein